LICAKWFKDSPKFDAGHVLACVRCWRKRQMKYEAIFEKTSDSAPAHPLEAQPRSTGHVADRPGNMPGAPARWGVEKAAAKAASEGTEEVRDQRPG
jgi:hypothetical protein